MADWKKSARFKLWIRPTKVPAIFERSTIPPTSDGFVVRTRMRTSEGAIREIKINLPGATLSDAVRRLEQERDAVRLGTRAGFQTGVQQPPPNPPAAQPASPMLFCEFAAQLFEAKVAAREIISEAGKVKFANILRQLIVGSPIGERPRGKSEDSRPIAVRGFGAMPVVDIRASHIADWRGKVASLLIGPGHYQATTCNGWLSVLKVIFRQATRVFELDRNPTEGLQAFDTSTQTTYTFEEPNALTADETSRFLAAMRRMFPQHFAMTALAFATGLRPSSLRPLRRSGPSSDIKWSDGLLLIRRSQTRGERAMERTKVAGLRQTIFLPPHVVEILRWHVDTQLLSPEQQESELLFPSITGGFRAGSVLNKPFALIAREIGLTKHFTVRGCRRTFNDLARVAGIGGLTTRSISGHLTESMQNHYSTVSGAEQRDAISRIVGVAGAVIHKGGDLTGS